ncbi:5-formyltetrahydrofolate cyclo-ligase, partial [mine drainage metagenome]
MVRVPPALGDADRLRLEGEKSRRRREVWEALQRERVARFPFPPQDRIPNFEGALEAAKGLAATPEFQAARVVKVNPDAPQLPVRTEVLRGGKLLVMSVPRLRDPRCFRLLRPGSAVPPTIERGMSRGEALLPEDGTLCGPRRGRERGGRVPGANGVGEGGRVRRTVGGRGLRPWAGEAGWG